MAEFNITSFVVSLRERMYNHFPNLKDRGRNPNGSFKHGQYNEEIRNVAFKNNPTIIVDENTQSFDIGNEYSEEHYPYYHILEDAPYIRKRDRSTAKTRGSQAKVESLKDRNYSFPTWNGKTFTQEYRRNVRGKRNRIDKVSHWITDSSGNKKFINREADSYLNEHYQYIERMLNEHIIDEIAVEFGLKPLRVQKTGLEEELAMEWGEDVSTILDIFYSHEGE